MSDEVLNNGGQGGQPESASQGGGLLTGAPAANGEQSTAPNEQPLSLTKSQLVEIVNAQLNAAKKDWLSESYRNTQSMNDKFAKRVSDTISAFEQAGIKADKDSVTSYLKEQDKRASAAAAAQQQRAQQANIDPGYQAFLNRFGAVNGKDARLAGAFSLEQEYGVTLEKSDPEFAKYFGDPKKRFSAYQFQRDYEKALTEKRSRTAETQTSPAAVPSMSGTGRQAARIQNNTSSADIFAMAMEEMRNNRR